MRDCAGFLCALSILLCFIPAESFSVGRVQWNRRFALSAQRRDDAALRPIARECFPLLQTDSHVGKPVIYLDNAATTQKPQCVLDEWLAFNSQFNANVHRGTYALAELATERYEAARDKIARFLNAQRREEIVFTSGATQGINMVAWGLTHTLSRGDEIVVTVAEHHSNFVPWQQLAQRTGATLRVVPLDPSTLLLDVKSLMSMVNQRTRIVSVTHISNVLGITLPIRKIAAAVHQWPSAVLVVDASQSAGHLSLDVQHLGADFLVGSGHKMFAPMGTGFLFGRQELLEQKLQPLFTGGEMVREVGEQWASFQPAPMRFEAGTPNVAGAVALGRAADWLESLNRTQVAEYEHKMGDHMRRRLRDISGLRILGDSANSVDKECMTSGGLVSFTVEDCHPLDIATFLDLDGICVRTGQHCAYPLHKALGVESSMRASIAMYNSMQDIDIFVDKLQEAVHLLRRGAIRTARETYM